MPRTKQPSPAGTVASPVMDTPLEQVFEDLRVMLTARRAEYQAAADRISDILGSITPKPRIGRPPKART